MHCFITPYASRNRFVVHHLGFLSRSLLFAHLSCNNSHRNSYHVDSHSDQVYLKYTTCPAIIRESATEYVFSHGTKSSNSDLVMCRKQPGIALGRLCDKCDGKCPVCDSYVRPTTLVRICDECSFGNYQNKCVVCGGEVCHACKL